jgi:hypothetical protein
LWQNLFHLLTTITCHQLFFLAQDPVRTNKIPRQIPEQPWYMHPVFSCLVGGVLPFGAVFIELFFILTSVWLHQFYYLFGFLALVFVILCLTCAEITIVLCYFQLCRREQGIVCTGWCVSRDLLNS